jgi:metal-sulfur cluster biosynthetic enzyme
VTNLLDSAPVPESSIADQADISLIHQSLYEVIDPELGVNIVDLGLIYGIAVTERIARIRMTLTTPGCPLSGYMDDEIHRVLARLPGVDDADVSIVWDPPWDPSMLSEAAKRQLGWRR